LRNYTADWASFVALSVYFYETHGITAVGIFGVVRMGAAVAAIPLASALVDRYPRQRVLLAIHLARGSALAVCALVLAMGGVLPLVFVLAGVIAFCGWPSSTVTVTPYRDHAGAGSPARPAARPVRAALQR
jgi:MFS family permease